MSRFSPITSIVILSLGSILFIALMLGWQWHRYQQTFSQSITKPADSSEDQRETLSFIPLFASDPILGDSTTPIRIVTFEDFLCPNCRSQQQFLRQLLEDYPEQVHIVWKDLPIVTLPYDSTIVHAYGYCANEQGLFAQFHKQASEIVVPTEALLSSILTTIDVNQNRFDACLESNRPRDHFEKNKLIATALNIQRVPIFFINDTQISTPQSYVEWTQLIEQQ